ncbi:hypothetical protein F4680DRAFT_467745 [Xylaria scruposa]|nr:hypothetical protein F4680DRAFT_467745 [Xylaria scruposa]
MVTPNCRDTSKEVAGSSRRSSRPCPPSPLSYPDRRRAYFSSFENRPIVMSDQEESNEPRKRIPIACGRCRKRKIRCSGDPGNGKQCSSCKNAGHEPCLFLRVSSQETPFNTEYTYNVDAARAYGNPRGAAVSPISPVTQYAHEVAPGDGLTAYRQSPYPYTSKDYYQNVSGWAGTYQDDGSVDYGLSYSSYPIVNQEPTSPVVSGYPTTTSYTARKPVYIQPAETTPSSYSYGSLAHRPAAAAGGGNNDAQGFSLSSMAASLPRRPSRLYSSINRTLTNPSTSTYRTDGLSAYQNGKTTTDVAYSTLQPAYESPYSTTATTTATPVFASDTPHRAAAAYPPVSTTAQRQLYSAASDPSIRSEDPSAGLSYVYSNPNSNNNAQQRHKRSITTTTSGVGGGSGSGSLLSNGQVYVPDSNPTTYAIPTSVALKIEVDPGSGSESNVSTGSSSQRHREDADRKSAGSLRGD